MNRRGFLGSLIGAAVLDPERLLWVPGQKLISVPERSGNLSIRLVNTFDGEAGLLTRLSVSRRPLKSAGYLAELLVNDVSVFKAERILDQRISDPAGRYQASRAIHRILHGDPGFSAPWGQMILGVDFYRPIALTTQFGVD